jgi:flagellin-like hook-associated protein FlgL
MSITLSSGVRQNLLSLQNTSDLMAKTQNRLATGKKVNSALDNPTNFFTASSLNSRASDLSNVLDGMSNAIKTLEAADNGLKAITRTVESLQSTVRQARQDNSFKSTSLTIGSGATGNISFSGGSLTAGVDISLTTGTTADATRASITGGTYTAPAAASPATAGQNTFSFGSDMTFGASDELTFDVSVDGGTAQTVTINQAAVNGVGNNDSVMTADDLVAIVNAANLGMTAANNSGSISFTSDTTGATSNVTISNVATSVGFTNTSGVANGAGTTGSAAVAAQTFSFTVSDGTNTTATINLTSANAGTAAEAADVIGAAMTAAGIVGTADVSGGGLRIRGAADGSNDLSVAGAGVNSAFGGSAPTVVQGSPATTSAVKSVSALVTEINGNSTLAAAGVQASNEDGKLKITFRSTSTTDLTIGGLNTDGTQATGGSGTRAVEGNEVRRSLENQFNELRTQLNRLADDASFNGVNLLNGDQLSVNFNETSTSSLNIASSLTGGVNTTSLGISEAADGDFGSQSALDDTMDSLNSALGTLRSQSSAFGSNLSVVQNRIDFTKSTINTLKTGADNLTLADMNEEAANLLSLQTRQQLSSTALSLASQADQGVLRLF